MKTEHPKIYELLSEWLRYIRHRFAKNTVINYENRLRQFRKAVPAKYEDLTPQHIERFLQNLPLATNSVNTHLTTIKSFCRWCEDTYSLSNPAKKVKFFKPIPVKQRILSPEELQQLIAAAKPNTKATLLFLANTGLRISEFRSLKSENISPDGRLFYVTSKGRQRAVPLNKTALKLLPTVLNFTKNYHNYYEIFCCLADKTGIEKFGPHALRHYYATELAKTVPLCILSKLLGHANTLITQQVYVHLQDNDLVGVTDILDKIERR